MPSLFLQVDVSDPGRPLLSDENSRHLTVFYTGLARALAFPRRLDEVDKAGRVLHYSPYDPAGTIQCNVVLVQCSRL